VSLGVITLGKNNLSECFVDAVDARALQL